jgi:hypothetical protein
MKRALILLTVLGLAFSPLMVSQAQAAPAKHHAAKHEKKHLKKKAAKKLAKHQAHKRKVAAV